MRIVVGNGLVLYWILSLIIFVICFAKLLACSFFLCTGKEKTNQKRKPPAVTTKLLRVTFGLKRTNALASLT